MDFLPFRLYLGGHPGGHFGVGDLYAQIRMGFPEIFPEIILISAYVFDFPHDGVRLIAEERIFSVVNNHMAEKRNAKLLKNIF